MNHISKILVCTALTTLLVACGGTEPDAAASGAAGAAPAQAPAVVPPPVDTLNVSVVSAKTSTQNGVAEGTKLVSNGKAGYLVFGPYKSFMAGAYTIKYVGSIDSLNAGSKVVLDVVSKKGRTVHATTTLTATGPLTALDFSLSENVPDLEVRISVPDGSKVSVESYEINKK